MRARHAEAILRQIYRRPGEPSAAHQAQLEARLTASFAERMRRGATAASGRKRMTVQRMLLAAMVCGTAIAASQLPAQFPVRVGEVLTIDVESGEPAPQPDVLMPILRRAGSTVARVRTRREARGVVVVAEVWGMALAGDLPAQVRAAFPSSRVSVSPLLGNLEGTVLDKVRYELLDLSDPQKIAQARAAVLQALAARGEKAEVDVSVRDVAGKPRPRILVRVSGQSAR